MSKQKKKKYNYFRLIIAIALPLAAGFLGSFATYAQIPTWYTSLAKPFFSPPNSIFGPVWTLLYILMGISFYIVWQTNVKAKKFALIVYFFQLLLNALWSIIFFSAHAIFFAFVELCVLWIAIAMTTQYFYKISKAAGYLLLPYLLWVSFAAILNFSLFFLNK